MSRRPNLTNPVAVIRDHLDLSIDAFAEFIGHGAPMLKHIEAGRKPMNDALADKIHAKTGADMDLLFRPKLRQHQVNALRRSVHVVPANEQTPWEVSRAALLLVPDVLSLAAAMMKVNGNAELVFASVRRELQKTALRWDLNQADIAVVRDHLVTIMSPDLIEAARQLVEADPGFKKDISVSWFHWLTDRARSLAASSPNTDFARRRRLRQQTAIRSSQIRPTS